MVVFEGQNGEIDGYAGHCDWANDSGAQFTFDEFGTVVFDSSGYDENSSVKVQLLKEYGRYFCSTSTCGGFKNWISQLGIVTPRPTGGRVTIIVMDSVQKTPITGAHVCLGLMCHDTPENGEVYVGQFAFGTYTLNITHPDYEPLTETLDVNAETIRTSRSLIPLGGGGGEKACEDFPAWLRPLCVFFRGLLKPLIDRLDKYYDAEIAPKLAWISARFDEVQAKYEDLVARAEEEAAAWRAGLDAGLADLRGVVSAALSEAEARIETNLIDPIRTGIAGIWKDLGELWTAAGEIVQRAEEEAAAWRKGVLDLEGSLKAWIEKEIIELFWKALTAEKKEEA